MFGIEFWTVIWYMIWYAGVFMIEAHTVWSTYYGSSGFVVTALKPKTNTVLVSHPPSPRRNCTFCAWERISHGYKAVGSDLQDRIYPSVPCCRDTKIPEVAPDHSDLTVFSNQHLKTFIYESHRLWIQLALRPLNRSFACRCELASTGNTDGALCDWLVSDVKLECLVIRHSSS